MGTVVLFPRDVRHAERDASSTSSSSNHASGCTPIHAGNRTTSNSNGSIHAVNDSVRKGSEGKRPKMKASYRPVRNPKSDNIPVFTILQRPKMADAVDPLILSKFLVKTDSTNTSGTLKDGAKECSPAYCDERDKSRMLDGPEKGCGKLSLRILEGEMKTDGVKAKTTNLDVRLEKSKPSKKSHKPIPKLYGKDLLANGGRSESSGKIAFDVVENAQQVVADSLLAGLRSSSNYSVEKSRPNTLQNLHVPKTSSSSSSSSSPFSSSSSLNGVVKAQQNVATQNLSVPKGSISSKLRSEQEIFNKKDEESMGSTTHSSIPHTPEMDGAAGLRRSSTDPQSVQCLAREMVSYNKEANPCESVQNLGGETMSCCSGANICKSSLYDSVKKRDPPASVEMFKCTNQELSNEKWAGPAYTSSPAPSALPLPKFTMPNVKLQTPSMRASYDHGIVPLVAVGQLKTSANIRRPICASPAGAYDVVLATKSLRRMLNLDL